MKASFSSIASPSPASSKRGPAPIRRRFSPVYADRSARPADEGAVRQLRLGAIIAIWAAAAIPMGVLSWVAAPLLADSMTGPGGLARALIVTLTAGLLWQFVLVMLLVTREQGTWRPSVLRDALWLRAPRAPRGGRRGGRLWVVVVPLLFAVAAVQLLPGLSPVAGRDFNEFLGSQAGHDLLAGAWGWFAVIAAMVVLNTVLGEELLFRGFLLPRMNGVFGRRDWIANGVLFAGYHLHVPWMIPTVLFDMFILAYPSKRYRSALIGIAVHSAQSVVALAIVLSLVLAG
jgi:membrane protease YdiL (CAAX protease family)